MPVFEQLNREAIRAGLRFLINGSSEPQDVALARELGACDYIAKPITAEQLQPLLKA